jgi:hypothetical protein
LAFPPNDNLDNPAASRRTSSDPLGPDVDVDAVPLDRAASTAPGKPPSSSRVVALAETIEPGKRRPSSSASFRPLPDACIARTKRLGARTIPLRRIIARIIIGVPAVVVVVVVVVPVPRIHVRSINQSIKNQSIDEWK